MVTVVVDFETNKKGYGIFKCPSELHHDINYQAIIKSTIIKYHLEKQPETEARNDLLNIIDMKINEEYTLASLRQTPGKDRFENTERLILSNIAMITMHCLWLKTLSLWQWWSTTKHYMSSFYLNVRNKLCHLLKSYN